MTRNPHALIDYLDDRADWSFGYADGDREQDCVRYCDGGVLAVTGVSPLSAVAETWSSEREARRVLAAHGGMASAVDDVMAPIPTTFAGRGDVGMTADSQLGLFDGDALVCLRPDRGLIRLPRAHAVRAWTLRADRPD